MVVWCQFVRTLAKWIPIFTTTFAGIHLFSFFRQNFIIHWCKLAVSDRDDSLLCLWRRFECQKWSVWLILVRILFGKEENFSLSFSDQDGQKSLNLNLEKTELKIISKVYDKAVCFISPKSLLELISVVG